RGRMRPGEMVRIALLAVAIGAVTLNAQIPSASYASRRAAAIGRIGSDLLIVPARGSFLADDQLGFVQASDFQYLTGLDELIGAVLVLDGTAKTSTLFVAPRNPLLTRGLVAADADTARRLQLSAIQAVDAFEPWLRQRFARGPTNVLVAPTDARNPVKKPLRIAGNVCSWRARLIQLGDTSHPAEM